MEKAYEYVRDNCENQERNVNFNVTCGLTGDRGLYLREATDFEKPKETAVTIEPKFVDHLSSELWLWVKISFGKI